MADYGEIESLAGQLKRSAIDAYMAQHGYDVRDSTYFNIQPDIDTLRTWGVTLTVLPFGFLAMMEGVTIQRPGTDGNGGGTGYAVNPGMFPPKRDLDISSVFDNIRNDIDTALTGWLDLPDPAESLEGYIQDCRDIRAQLASEGAVDNGTASAPSEISQFIADAIADSQDGMAGATMETFNKNVLRKMGSVVSGLECVTVILGSALTAERDIITETRSSTAEVVDHSRAAFDDLAKRMQQYKKELELKFAEKLVDTATSFVGGDLPSNVASGVKGVLTFAIEAERIKDKYCIEGGDYSSLLTSFKGGLDQLSSNLKESELAIGRNLQKNSESMRANQDDFSLTLGAINDEDVDEVGDSTSSGAEVVIMNHAQVEAIYGQHLPGVANELGSVQNKPYALSIAAWRDMNIGDGPKGPTEPFNQLKELLCRLLSDLALKTRMAAHELELVLATFDEADQQVADSMKELDDYAGDGGTVQREQQQNNPWYR